jgi:hypothetical protein
MTSYTYCPNCNENIVESDAMCIDKWNLKFLVGNCPWCNKGIFRMPHPFNLCGMMYYNAPYPWFDINYARELGILMHIEKFNRNDKDAYVCPKGKEMEIIASTFYEN